MNGPLLRKGQRFEMAGRTYRVEYVSESRAHCVTTVKTTVTLRSGRTYVATSRKAIDISPNSGLEVLAELEQAR